MPLHLWQKLILCGTPREQALLMDALVQRGYRQLARLLTLSTYMPMEVSDEPLNRVGTKPYTVHPQQVKQVIAAD